MSLQAVYAGPFFNMCLGIGLSFLWKANKMGGEFVRRTRVAAIGRSFDGRFYVDSLDSSGLIDVCGSVQDVGDVGKSPTLIFASCWLILVCLVTMAFAGWNGLHLPPVFGKTVPCLPIQTGSSLPSHCGFTAFSLWFHCLLTVVSLPSHCGFTAFV